VLRFLIRRILHGAVVLVLVTMVVFALFYVGPTQSVARTIAGRQATPAVIEAVTHRLGLDRPLLAQYGHFVWLLLHGNLGYDYYNQVPVTTVLKQAWPITFSLAIGAAVIWLILGVVSGIISAVRPRSFIDRALTGAALVFYSMPTFVLGILMLYGFFYQLTIHHLAIFPATGFVSFTKNPYQWARHLVLPWFTIALISAATYTRLTRSSMLEVLGEDYIRTARAKGLSERRVVLRHGLRSALTPIVTQFGIDLGTLLGGAIITEVVFGLPGLGYESIKAITSQDLPVIVGVVIIASTAVVVANVLVDVLYAVLDPRVRLH